MGLKGESGRGAGGSVFKGRMYGNGCLLGGTQGCGKIYEDDKDLEEIW